MTTKTRRMTGALLAALALAAGVAAARGGGGALALNEQAGYFGSGHDAGQQRPAPV
jgi:hypothetical protein